MHEREEEKKHVIRMNEMEEERRKNWGDIKKKHSQNMHLFEKHSQLLQENDQYKKSVEKFTDCNEDILSNLHRDQYSQRMRDHRYTQEVLKNQMEEYKEKRSVEKSHILEGSEMEKSIFKALLHNNQHNKKAYGEELKNQMSEVDIKKTEEIKNIKEKYQIKGIFGGEQGRDREYQIQYVDRKLGLLESQRKPSKSTALNSSHNNILNGE